MILRRFCRFSLVDIRTEFTVKLPFLIVLNANESFVQLGEKKQ